MLVIWYLIYKTSNCVSKVCLKGTCQSGRLSSNSLGTIILSLQRTVVPILGFLSCV